MPIYTFEHPKTGEIFEDLRPMKDIDKPFIAPDGVECKRAIPTSVYGWLKNREGYEIDSSYYKKMSPKYVRKNDGTREKYDPTKHC